MKAFLDRFGCLFLRASTLRTRRSTPSFSGLMQRHPHDQQQHEQQEYKVTNKPGEGVDKDLVFQCCFKQPRLGPDRLLAQKCKQQRIEQTYATVAQVEEQTLEAEHRGALFGAGGLVQIMTEEKPHHVHAAEEQQRRQQPEPGPRRGPRKARWLPPTLHSKWRTVKELDQNRGTGSRRPGNRNAR